MPYTIRSMLNFYFEAFLLVDHQCNKVVSVSVARKHVGNLDGLFHNDEKAFETLEYGPLRPKLSNK